MRADRNQSVLERGRRAANLRLNAPDRNSANFSFLTDSAAATDVHRNGCKTKEMLIYISGLAFPI